MQETPGIAATKSKARLREALLLLPDGKAGTRVTKATALGTEEPSPLQCQLSGGRLRDRGPGDTPPRPKGLPVPCDEPRPDHARLQLAARIANASRARICAEVTVLRAHLQYNGSFSRQ